MAKAIICPECRGVMPSRLAARNGRVRCTHCGTDVEIQAPTRLCSVCGADISQQPRMKDRDGVYYCMPCAAELGAAHGLQVGDQMTYPCSVCGQWFWSDDVYQLEGRCVCRTCYQDMDMGGDVLPADRVSEAPAAAPVSSGQSLGSPAWFVNDAGLEIGPMSRDELEAALAQQRFGADAMVWREGFARWVPFAYRDVPDQAPVSAEEVAAAPVDDGPQPLPIAISEIHFEWTTKDGLLLPLEMQSTWIASYSFKLTNSSDRRRIMNVPLELTDDSGNVIYNATAGVLTCHPNHTMRIASRLSIDRNFALYITGMRVLLQPMDEAPATPAPSPDDRWQISE